jgi:hypothetical protein
MLLAFGQGRRWLEGGPKIAHQSIGLAQGEIFGRRADRRAFDQLVGPLHLLTPRALRRRAAFLGPQAHARIRRRKSLGDRWIKGLRLGRQRSPFLLQRVPRRLIDLRL